MGDPSIQFMVQWPALPPSPPPPAVHPTLGPLIGVVFGASILSVGACIAWRLHRRMVNVKSVLEVEQVVESTSTNEERYSSSMPSDHESSAAAPEAEAASEGAADPGEVEMVER